MKIYSNDSLLRELVFHNVTLQLKRKKPLFIQKEVDPQRVDRAIFI